MGPSVKGSRASAIPRESLSWFWQQYLAIPALTLKFLSCEAGEGCLRGGLRSSPKTENRKPKTENRKPNTEHRTPHSPHGPGRRTGNPDYWHNTGRLWSGTGLENTIALLDHDWRGQTLPGLSKASADRRCTARPI